MKPTQDWMVLVHAEESKEANLIIPETAKPIFNKTMAHEVVDIGPWDGWPNQGEWCAHDVSIGDVVIMEGLDARSFEYQGQVYYIARARDVVCVVKRQGK